MVCRGRSLSHSVLSGLRLSHGVMTVHSSHAILLEGHPLSLRQACWRWSPEASFPPRVTSYSPSSPRSPQTPGPEGCVLCPAWEQNFRAFRFCLFLKNNKKSNKKIKKSQQLSVLRLRPSELGSAWHGGGAVKKPQINRAVSWPSQASSCGKAVVGACGPLCDSW